MTIKYIISYYKCISNSKITVFYDNHYYIFFFSYSFNQYGKVLIVILNTSILEV